MDRPPGWLERGLTLAGLLLLVLWIRGYDQAQVFRAEGTKELDAARLSAALSVAEPSAPRGTLRTQGSKGSRAVALDRGILGRIEIPRLGISALIAEGTEPRQLEQAVGHIASSAFPGQDGNCALAGHRDSFLRGLGKVREKDLIRIDTPRDTYTYQVEWGSVVKPEQVDVLDRTREPSLTLVTCYPFQVIGPAPERFVVRAKLIESTD